MGGDNPEEWQGCKGRSLMLTPYGKVAGVASDSGEATVTVGRVGDADACTCTCIAQVDAIMHAPRSTSLTLTLTLARWTRSTSSTHATRLSSRC